MKKFNSAGAARLIVTDKGCESLFQREHEWYRSHSLDWFTRPPLADKQPARAASKRTWIPAFRRRRTRIETFCCLPEPLTSKAFPRNRSWRRCRRRDRLDQLRRLSSRSRAVRIIRPTKRCSRIKLKNSARSFSLGVNRKRALWPEWLDHFRAQPRPCVRGSRDASPANARPASRAAVRNDDLAVDVGKRPFQSKIVFGGPRDAQRGLAT